MLLSLSSLLLALLLGEVVLCEEVRIENAADLISFSESVNKGTSYAGKTVLLDADIVFTAELSQQFGPIGKGNIYFSGTFDGQGYKITGLTINSTSLEYVGLFGHSDWGTIRNVVMDSSCSVTSYGGTHLGSVIGIVESDDGASIVENCVSMASVTYRGNSSVEVNIGGIAGYINPEAAKTPVKNCVNYGSVTCYGTSSGRYNLGGIAGSSGIVSNTYLQNCLNYGEIKYSGESPASLYIGGLIGYGSRLIVENCVSTGRIDSSVKPNAIGTIVGYVYGNVNITHCFWTADVGCDNFYGEKSSSPGISFDYSQVSLVSLNRTTVDELNEYAETKGWNSWVLNPGNKTVSFKINERSPFSFSSQLILLPDPVEVDEARFSGWYKDSCLSEEFMESAVSEDMYLYGLYGSFFTVTFDGNGGTPSKQSKAVVYSSSYGDLPTASRTGYKFVGWFTGKVDGDNITKDSTFRIAGEQTLYAHWEIIKYTVTFDLSNGTEINADFPFNETIQYPEGITMEGFTFYGWAPNPERMPAEDITITGYWLPNNYTIIFDGNGGTPPTQYKHVFYNNSYGDLPTASRTGYAFVGWFTGKVDGDNITKDSVFRVAGEQTLYAHWEVNNYTVTFDFNNGTVFNADFPFNETIKYPEDVTREGFTFVGWAPNPERMPAEDITITAQWNVSKPTEYVEIVFEKRDMSEEEVKKVIGKYLSEGEEFTIENIEVDKTTGETVVVIKFEDKDKASDFIRKASEDKKAGSNSIKVIRPAGDYKGSLSTCVCPALLTFLLL